MLKPKISTTISKLMIGDYFVPKDGEDQIYDYGGYDDEWCLWVGINCKDGNIRLFDDFECVWLPYFNPKTDMEFLNHRKEFCESLYWN